MHKKWQNTCAVVLALSVYPCLLLSVGGQEAAPDSRRIEELEKENLQLKQVTELNAQELDQLRRKIMEMETALPDAGEDDDTRVLFGSSKWTYTVGVITLKSDAFGDAVSRIAGFNASIPAGGTSEKYGDGSQTGYGFSAGKDKNRYGITIYQGKYDGGNRVTVSPEVWGDNHTINNRIDLDLAWTGIAAGNDRFGLGYIVGAKYLHASKEIIQTEVKDNLRDEKTYRGHHDWLLANAGFFVSARFVRDYPLSLFISGSIALGEVSGMVVEHMDDSWDDGVVDSIYRTGSSAAWGVNGTIGLQHPMTSHGMIRVGIRGQTLDSTDGLEPFIKGAKYFDAHRGLFLAMDVLF